MIECSTDAFVALVVHFEWCFFFFPCCNCKDGFGILPDANRSTDAFDEGDEHFAEVVSFYLYICTECGVIVHLKKFFLFCYLLDCVWPTLHGDTVTTGFRVPMFDHCMTSPEPCSVDISSFSIINYYPREEWRDGLWFANHVMTYILVIPLYAGFGLPTKAVLCTSKL